MTDHALEARLAIVQRQRDYEWLTTTARIRDQAHDLRNLIQIVELASAALRGQVSEELAALVDEVERVALKMKGELGRRASGVGAPVGATVRAAVELLRPAVGELALTLQIAAHTTTVLAADELEQVVLGLVADGGRHATSIELFVRERRIADAPWIELVCGIDAAEGELRGVRAIVEGAGGEVSSSERRGGGTEIAVALPAM